VFFIKIIIFGGLVRRKNRLALTKIREKCEAEKKTVLLDNQYIKPIFKRIIFFVN
jgi:hypothetical protein